MAHLITWSRRATEDLEEIAAYIAKDSEVYAASVVRKILKKVKVLTDFPFLGRVVPEFADENLREVFAYNYRILYRIDRDEIDIAAVIHGRRLLDVSLKP
jgi:toxin ParE1/3/4